MLINTSKSEAMVLSMKWKDCSFWVLNESLTQVRDFNYLEVLFLSEGTMEREMAQRIGAAGVVLCLLYCTVVMKIELSQKAKLNLLVNLCSYYHQYSWWMGHDKKNETVDSTAEMGFFRRVAGVSIRDRVRSSVIHEKLRADAPLLIGAKWAIYWRQVLLFSVNFNIQVQIIQTLLKI